MSDPGVFTTLLRRLARAHRLSLLLIAVVAVAWFAVTMMALRRLDVPTAGGAPAPLQIAELSAQVGLGAILLLIVIEALLVVRPTIRRLRRAHDAREQTRDELATAHARVLDSETRFRSSFDSAAIGMALVALDGRITEANRALCEMLGHDEQGMAGSALAQFSDAGDAPAIVAHLRRLATGDIASARFEQKWVRADGASVWGLVAMAAVADANGTPLYAVAQIEDITTRKRAEQNAARYASELRQLALTDDLTRVYNRRGFRVLAEQACLAQQRSEQPLMLVAVDVDRLKSINDRFGHAAGDRAIMIVATALSSTFRTSDVIGRMGGDEFLCLLPDASGTSEEQVRARFGSRLVQLSADLREEFPVTAAVGVALAPPGAMVNLDDLIKQADRSLYEAKHARMADAFDIPPAGGPNRLR